MPDPTTTNDRNLAGKGLQWWKDMSGLSHAEIAAKAGASRSTISNMINGNTRGRNSKQLIGRVAAHLYWTVRRKLDAQSEHFFTCDCGRVHKVETMMRVSEVEAHGAGRN